MISNLSNQNIYNNSISVYNNKSTKTPEANISENSNLRNDTFKAKNKKSEKRQIFNIALLFTSLVCIPLGICLKKKYSKEFNMSLLDILEGLFAITSESIAMRFIFDLNDGKPKTSDVQSSNNNDKQKESNKKNNSIIKLLAVTFLALTTLLFLSKQTYNSNTSSTKEQFADLLTSMGLLLAGDTAAKIIIEEKSNKISN